MQGTEGRVGRGIWGGVKGADVGPCRLTPGPVGCTRCPPPGSVWGAPRVDATTRLRRVNPTVGYKAAEGEPCRRCPLCGLYNTVKPTAAEPDGPFGQSPVWMLQRVKPRK